MVFDVHFIMGTMPVQEFYPPHDQQKLAELAETCQLMETVLEFQQQVSCLYLFKKLFIVVLSVGHGFSKQL